jgi:hypothetical protein
MRPVGDSLVRDFRAETSGFPAVLFEKQLTVTEKGCFFDLLISDLIYRE